MGPSRQLPPRWQRKRSKKNLEVPPNREDSSGGTVMDRLSVAHGKHVCMG